MPSSIKELASGGRVYPEAMSELLGLNDIWIECVCARKVEHVEQHLGVPTPHHYGGDKISYRSRQPLASLRCTMPNLLEQLNLTLWRWSCLCW